MLYELLNCWIVYNSLAFILQLLYNMIARQSMCSLT
jgi:hypothetical protein